MTSEPTTRVRGIYSTAVTQLLAEAKIVVVDPSPTIAERFDGPFPDRLAHVSIRSTVDRQGVQIDGDPDGVDRVAAILGNVSDDTFRWDDSLSTGSIFAGRIDRTTESGAIVELGERRAFLPYGRTDEYVEAGDAVPVQVIDPGPTWATRRRPVVSTIPHSPGRYVDLVGIEADERITADSVTLQRMVDMLDPSIPDGWHVDVRSTAEDVAIETLEADLDAVLEVADRIDRAMDEATSATDRPVPVSDVQATTWCRFGREGRFALDAVRGQVTATIDGHHRLKAGGRIPGRAVDFAERLGVTHQGFDPDVVLDTFGPCVDDRVRIEHVKPTGLAVTLGQAEVTERSGGGITVSRTLSTGGTLDALDVPKEAGDVAETTFVEGRWWYPTVYRDGEGEWKGTYVNVGTPIEIFPERVRYVDLFVDVIKETDGTVRVVDEDELADAEADGVAPEPLASKARDVAAAIEESLT